MAPAFRGKLMQPRVRSPRKILFILLVVSSVTFFALHPVNQPSALSIKRILRITGETNKSTRGRASARERSKSLYSVGEKDIAHVASAFFPAYRVVYMNGIAYDLYSIRELGQLNAAPQWLTFPLPGETNSVQAWTPNVQSKQTFPVAPSPKTKSSLAYVDDIYVITDRAFTDRIANVKQMFRRQGLPVRSIQWSMGERNRSKCDGEIKQGEHHRVLNLTPGRIGDSTQQRYCYVTMQHVQVWHRIAASSAPLSLVLEDDAVFVPFFKEKFDRFVYTAIRTGALNTNTDKCATPRHNASANEWLNQDPIFEVGACANLRDASFPPEDGTATPRLSLHKERCSRCSHGYALTPCSAQALLRTMFAKKMGFHIIDWLQIHLAQISATLQPFWLDPALVYQGSQALDFNKLPTFGRSMTQQD